MPGDSSVHVRFYGQLYDSTNASLVGDAFLIGEDTIGTISGFNSVSNQGTVPNWKFASTTFDTTNYSGKFLVFWVVAWAEENGKLMTEQEGHGLTGNPRDLTFKQITEVPVEDYSNNVGMYGTYTPFFVAPNTNNLISAQDKSRGASTEGDFRSLQAGDVQVEAAAVDSGSHRSRVTVTVHNTTGGELRAVPVLFYDGDPAYGGRLFDFQRIPCMGTDDTYAFRTFFRPQGSGRHDVYVRIGQREAAPLATAATAVMAP